MNKRIRRGLATMALAAATVIAVPAMASADTLVYKGTTDNGKYEYTNANTGQTIISATYLGATFDTACEAVR